MADDLDAFFDEVDEAEQQVKESEVDKNSSTVAGLANNIDDIKAKLDTKDNDAEQAQPPTKKQKTSSSSIPDAEAATSSSKPTVNSSSKRGTVVIAKKAVVASASPQPSTTQQTKKETVIHHITVPEHLTQPHQQPHQPLIQPPLPTQPPLPSGGIPIEKKSKAIKRSAAGKTWTDETLADFPENDFRLFVGNLPKDINDAKLAEVFSSKYSSFVMARVIYDKTSQTSKGYGFVSLLDARECARAIREMDQSWLGSRPIKVKFSDWKDRDAKQVQKNNRKNKKNKRW